MSATTRYIKRPVTGTFEDWTEREFEELERVLSKELTCYKWDDLSFPSQILRTGGASTEPSVDTDGTLIFAGTTNNQSIAVVAQMPHAWVDGTAIRPHIHLQFKTSASANTRWKLTWDIANVNGDFGATTGNETITVANAQNVNKHAIAAWTEIAMTGFRDSAVIKFTITRMQSDAADTDTNAANLIAFDVHYQRNSHGSFAEYPS